MDLVHRNIRYLMFKNETKRFNISLMLHSKSKYIQINAELFFSQFLENTLSKAEEVNEMVRIALFSFR